MGKSFRQSFMLFVKFRHTALWYIVKLGWRKLESRKGHCSWPSSHTFVPESDQGSSYVEGTLPVLGGKKTFSWAEMRNLGLKNDKQTLLNSPLSSLLILHHPWSTHSSQNFFKSKSYKSFLLWTTFLGLHFLVKAAMDMWKFQTTFIFLCSSVFLSLIFRSIQGP